jgi:hypothetical protein
MLCRIGTGLRNASGLTNRQRRLEKEVEAEMDLNKDEGVGLGETDTGTCRQRVMCNAIP